MLGLKKDLAITTLTLIGLVGYLFIIDKISKR